MKPSKIKKNKQSNGHLNRSPSLHPIQNSGIGCVVFSLFLSIFSLPIIAHPNGTSKTDVHILPDSIKMVIDVNSGDVLNLVISSSEKWRFTPESRIYYQKRIADYFQSRIIVRIDGERLSTMNVQLWYPGGKGPEDTMDSISFSASTIVYTVTWPRNPDANEMEYAAQMFAEFEILAINQLKVFWHDSLIGEKFLSLDDSYWLKLNPEHMSGLAKEIAKQKAQELAAQTRTYEPKQSGNGIIIIITGIAVFVVLLFGVVLLRRKKRPTK
ncbi:MAG: hypothetical protein HQK83_11605 [Fibrobacteria bacterium]|nr:hypothetical protein [Fibrobacteria bacterium]